MRTVFPPKAPIKARTRCKAGSQYLAPESDTSATTLAETSTLGNAYASPPTEPNIRVVVVVIIVRRSVAYVRPTYNPRASPEGVIRRIPKPRGLFALIIKETSTAGSGPPPPPHDL